MPPTAEHAEAVDHRGVRVGAEEGVRHRDAVAHDDDLREPLEVHLVADARARWDDAEGLEGLARPTEERIALAVALVLALEVALVDVLRAEEIGLDGVVDDQVDRNQRLDLRRVLTRALHRRAHRGEVDRSGHAGVVLKKDARGPEGDRCVVSRIPQERLSCSQLGIAAYAPDALEKDLHGDGQPAAIVHADKAVDGSVQGLSAGDQGHLITTVDLLVR
jgi:hypothetical protein